MGLEENALVVGDATNTASPLPSTNTSGALLQQDINGVPVWSRNINVDVVDATSITTTGSIIVGSDLTVSGTAANLPAGSVDNTELENSSINLNYGTGLSGDPSVALGGTLNVQNTGVTEAAAGTGIALDQSTGTVTISNTGVTAITGTANQVIADQSTGNVTLSLPQDIHTDAVPTFDGATLDNLTSTSTSQDLVVSNAGSLETRTFSSLHPGGILPFGTTNNTILRWDGTGWVENTTVTADNAGNVTTTGSLDLGGNATLAGDLTVSGTAANLPAGSVDNTELENSSINLNYGTGLSGDPSVALGGTLNVQNTGVTEAAAGTGIALDQSTGTVTISNTGVTAITGTANQVIADQSTGNVTLSLPQDIHTDAVPTFDGATLDNLTSTSTSQDLVVSNAGSLETRTFSSLHPGGILPFGTTNNTILRWDGTGWVENTTVTADNAGNVTTTGSLDLGGNATLAGDLTVSGTAANLPAGSVDNTELENSSINLNYGTGLSGDPSVALGGTLNVQNTGVTEAAAGTGIALDQSTGTVTISNTGVTAITGTANQVIADQSTGNVTLSLPQDIHTDAVPTFDGATLDNLTSTSTSQDLVVSNAGSLETRTFSSLHPGGILPFGTTNNTILRWDGTGWVENTTVTADNAGNITTTGSLDLGGNATLAGDLTVNGTAANLPAGSVDNTELENSSINLNYGTGLSGDPSVALGGTLNVQNTGVTEAAAGTGIALDQSTGTVTISNTGVTAITGTANQVIADQSTGNVTLSLPQDIHTDAVPTFDGIVLDNLTGASNSTDLVVLNGSAAETRTVASLASEFDDLFWTTTGNTGTTPGTNFVGTTDAQALHVYVNGGTDNSLILNTNGSVQRDNSGNARGTNAVDLQMNRSAATQVASGSHAVIAGGQNNEAGASYATVGGGFNNSVAVNYATIAGGRNNIIEASSGVGTIAGGYANAIRSNSFRSAIGGGRGNEVGTGSTDGTISGGYNNRIGNNSGVQTIGGGVQNTIADNTIRSTIGGGYQNHMATGAGASVIAGGEQDSIYDGSWQATIAGGGRNVIGSSSWLATIGGGRFNSIGNSSVASVIAGGTSNSLTGRLSSIVGGRELTLIGDGVFGFLANESGNFDMSVTADETAIFGNTDLWLANNDNGASALRFYEANNTTGTFPGTTNFSSFRAQDQTGDIEYVLPADPGTAGQVLRVASVSGTELTLDWGQGTMNIGDSAWSLTGNTGTTPGTNFRGNHGCSGSSCIRQWRK